ncbi:TolC family outer membrane protein [Azonexus sp. R2A61]|uniref:TolC family outer membrane protein n=1 Tax=Azonexus sp. R2A61 TaxID=2744443 RepID=UPI001F3634D8|nr:TolC family outer membrane protein [Azonexus sp. R2A61]
MRQKILPLLLATIVIPAFAQETAKSPDLHSTLKQVAQQAVLQSPEVTTKWRNYRAAEEEIGVARGGFFPRVDLTAGKGRENLQQDPTAKEKYTRTGYAVTLNQMLFDGFATRNEVRRLNKAMLVRYYELLEASENTSLEAARAYLDVLRYRFLLDLAEDNYVQHKATYEQLLRKTQSGVGRRVDLEQAGSRLALAEINLATESANLHDVSARYQRLVGTQAPDVIFPPAQASAAFPENAKSALDMLHKKNPTLHAAIENIEAAQYDLYVKRAAYSPKLDLRGRTESTENYLGNPGDRDYNVAEVVVTWNLFNGGSDRAREKQFMERKHLAIEMREKACRDTRQTLLIAYNDVLRLREQSNYLAQQVSLLEKTRDAYRDQFNVGQRTLLDLLDTENELLSARRAAVNADSDLTLAYLRTYAGMGTLLEFLGLQRLDSPTPGTDELAEVDPKDLCPADPVAVLQPNREALDSKAMASLEAPKAPVILPATAPAALPASDESEIAARMKSWAAAWSAKDYSAYSSFYAPTFTPDGGLSREDWDQLRRARISPRERISVEVEDIRVRMDGTDRAFAEFRQTYRSNIFNDTVSKTLEMIKVNGKWLINRESSVPCAGNTVGGCKGGAK